MSGTFYFKEHKHPKETLFAICDSEILGETFRDGDIRITVEESFYGGDLIEEVDLRSVIGSFTIINIVGNRAVDLAIEEGIIDPECVIVIGGVKHAQAVTL
ncbi:hypothetical protein TALC_01556 [Thermoplasmatales archaeon BRNA1]|nr:hypothetical protein TALC_01556 [Thermoplasmatales archaeon BRNA1]